MAWQILAEMETLQRRPVGFAPDLDRRFPDSETCARLEMDPAGLDVFLVQCLYDPTSPRSVDENFMALLIAARAFKEYGARRVTAVLPHLAYTRQDRPTASRREPVTSRLAVELAVFAGIDALLCWYLAPECLLHLGRSIPIVTPDASSFFAEALRRFAGKEGAVLLAPDQGAREEAQRVADRLGIPVAYAMKLRKGPEAVEITGLSGVLGDIRNILLLDDLLSTAATLHALAERLRTGTRVENLYAAVSHALWVGTAAARLEDMHNRLGLRRLIVTDSVPQPEEIRRLGFVERRPIARQLARLILEQAEPPLRERNLLPGRSLQASKRASAGPVRDHLPQ